MAAASSAQPLLSLRLTTLARDVLLPNRDSEKEQWKAHSKSLRGGRSAARAQAVATEHGGSSLLSVSVTSNGITGGICENRHTHNNKID